MSRVRPSRAAAAVALGVGLAFACASAELFEEEPRWPTPLQGAVVCEHPLAAGVGQRILDGGGNAADAAVATALALAVAYPQAGNLGGGGFALWVPHGGAPEALDFRELAPAAADPSLYLDADGAVVAQRSLATALAVGVPGSPSGLFELYRRHGSGNFSFTQLCRPAIELAERGFEVDPWLARDLRASAARARLAADPAAAALFLPGGEPLAEGDTLRQPELAGTLRRFAALGPRGFYTGDVAQAIVATVAEADRRAGGLGARLTLEDLAGYQPEWRAPIVSWFRGWEVIGMPPPSSGGIAVAQTLGILGGFPLDAERDATLAARELGLSPASEPSGVSPRAVHWWIEALRRAFADRATHLGDPDVHPVPVRALLSAEWIAERRFSIGERADPGVRAMPVPEGPRETTHVSVVDRRGNAVSLTTTLNGAFGSGILVPGAGFLLNNELDDFSIQAGTPNQFGLVGRDANQLAPGKRPLSSMTPTVVRDGNQRVALVLGSPDGPRIITAVVQVLLRVLVYEQELDDAVRAPRLHQQWEPPETRFESGWDPRFLDILGTRHEQPWQLAADARFGSVQAIAIDPGGRVRATSDPRRGGAAALEGEPLPRPARPGDPLRGPELVRDAAGLAPR